MRSLIVACIGNAISLPQPHVTDTDNLVVQDIQDQYQGQQYGSQRGCEAPVQGRRDMMSDKVADQGALGTANQRRSNVITYGQYKNQDTAAPIPAMVLGR